MMELTKRQIELMREAGVQIDHAEDYEYSADDEERIADLLMDSLASGQEMTPKAREVRELLFRLADQS